MERREILTRRLRLDTVGGRVRIARALLEDVSQHLWIASGMEGEHNAVLAHASFQLNELREVLARLGE